jgi:hypothetical protein
VEEMRIAGENTKLPQLVLKMAFNTITPQIGITTVLIENI